MEEGSTCWGQVLHQHCGTVYENPLCNVEVCAGGCMVGIFQGCMYLVQVSAVVPLLDRNNS